MINNQKINTKKITTELLFLNEKDDKSYNEVIKEISKDKESSTYQEILEELNGILEKGKNKND